MSKKSLRRYGRKISKQQQCIARSGQYAPGIRPPQIDIPGPVVLACAEVARSTDPAMTGKTMFQELLKESREQGLEAFQTWFDVEFPMVYHTFKYRKTQ